MRKKNSGFTLIEMMIVVAIIGVLSTIAFNAYTEQVRKAKRAEGKGALLAAAQRLERYATNNGRYPPTLVAANISDKSSKDDPARSPYNIAIAAGATTDVTTSWVLTATPSTYFADPRCGNLSFDNLGQKTVSINNTAANIAYCWA
jgi:type IV pilus assembly protein PilE